MSRSPAGGPRLTYYVSGTYNDEDGIEPNNFGKAFNGRANLSFLAVEQDRRADQPGLRAELDASGCRQRRLAALHRVLSATRSCIRTTGDST